jgi:LysR family hydrogen peroxide-inducible transcriptional activator
MNPGLPHSFTLRQLQYVVAVADAAHFGRAAKACHVSQPSLSAQVAQVEDALGVRLFERDRRGVLTTPAGVEVVARARQLLVDADALAEAAKRSVDPLAGPLRLGVIPTISPYLLPNLTPALRRAFPQLRPLWVEERTPTLMRQLHAGDLDAALVALEAELGDVEHVAIATDPFVLAARRNDPLAEGRAVERAELKDAEVLLLDDGHCFRDQALSFCTRVKAREAEFRATSLTTLAQMVAGGSGVTLLPQLAVKTEAARARLKVRPFASPAPARTIALV